MSGCEALKNSKQEPHVLFHFNIYTLIQQAHSGMMQSLSQFLLGRLLSDAMPSPNHQPWSSVLIFQQLQGWLLL